MSEPTTTQPPANEDPEKSFWDKLGKLVDDRFDAGIERALGKYTKPNNSRNGGRTSVPQVLANLMWGPEKSE